MIDGQVEDLVKLCAGTRFLIDRGPVWLRVLPEDYRLPEHGWKLHVSARAANFAELIGTLVPLLINEACPFKLARSASVLSRINEGRQSPAAVGKAVTVYPDQRRVGELGLMLADALRGHQGPRVLSDRRVAEGAPVYYRYGPFAGFWEVDERGRLTQFLRGPDGERFDALATLAYRQPAWVTDPFRSAGTSGPDVPAVLGERYRIVAGLREAAAGNVYRAIDERDGSPVVVKQARAYVAENRDGNDARLYLRNEVRVLRALTGVTGIPRYIDHFRHGDDEFLVTVDCGEASLGEDVRRYGRYGPRGARSLTRLARQLARILIAVHGCGVVMRDLSPKNVVVGDGMVSLVDFGIAAHDGFHLPGRTPGYAPARQFRGEPPLDIDDLSALGMTLLFAATGLNPSPIGDDPDEPRLRALATIRAGHGVSQTGTVAAIEDLLSGDGARARRALGRLASDAGYRRRVHRPRIALAPVNHDLAAEVTRGLLSDVVTEAERILHGTRDTRAEHDANLYTGTAGIGRELLRHIDDPAVAAVLPEFAAFTARAARRAGLAPGLFTGGTGVAVFLAEAHAHGIGAGCADFAVLPRGWIPAGDDLISGAAGVGLGSLLLYGTTGDSGHLAIARQCAEAIIAGGEASVRAIRVVDWGDDTSAGSAHGLAGIAEFLLAYAAQGGDARVREAAADRTRLLARCLPGMIRQARRPPSAPLAVSWCRGLTGVGLTLLHASAVLGDPALADAAMRAADVCAGRVSGLPIMGQCCGAAGLGMFFLELATAGQQERYLAEAQAVAAHMLLRSAGPPGHPVFVERGPYGTDASWAAGLAGLLAFFGKLTSSC